MYLMILFSDDSGRCEGAEVQQNQGTLARSVYVMIQHLLA